MMLFIFILVLFDPFLNMRVPFGTQVSLMNRKTAQRTLKNKYFTFTLCMVLILVMFYLQRLGYKLLILVIMIFVVNYLVKFNVKVAACIAFLLIDIVNQLMRDFDENHLCFAIL